jgi:hypothetical protein
MRRALIAATSAMLLLAVLPGAAAAGRVIRFDDHHVGFFCDAAFDGGFVVVGIDSSSAFGDSASAEIWLDPAIPFDEPATMAGATDSVDIVEGATDIQLSATILVTDAEGSEQVATLVGTMTPSGDPQPVGQPSNGNHHSATTGTFQPYEGSGTLTLPDLEIELPQCFGDVTDTNVFENNPRSFVSSNEGVTINCFWETPDMAAGFFAIQDFFGLFADASLTTADSEIFGTGEYSGVMSAESVSTTIGLIDHTTGDMYSASAHATFEPVGSSVTSTRLGDTSRLRVTEQLLSPTGEVEFSTGDTFVIDAEHCFAVEFRNHAVTTGPAGPKAGGAVPINDAPDGAITVSPGDRFNVPTGGASLDAEQPIVTCPEGEFDTFGRTLWYTIEGTGDPVTVDTAGSNFDTLIGVYESDGEVFTEIACIDDVFFDPIGATYQAALTFDTIEGTTYYIQVGGYLDPFAGTTQFGRLRLAIS